MGEVDQPLLRSLVIAAGNYAKAAAGAFVQMGEPAGILLLIDEGILSLFRAEAMPPDLHRAMVVVELDVEKAPAVRAPHRRAVGFLDDIVKVRGSSPIAHADGKILRSLGVGAPGLQLVIRRMPAAAEPEIFIIRR